MITIEEARKRLEETRKTLRTQPENKLTEDDFEEKMRAETGSFSGRYFFNRLYNKHMGPLSLDPLSKLDMHKKMKQRA